MDRKLQDLLIVTDATGSMEDFLLALTQAVPEILALSQLTGAYERIGIIAYRDYSEEKDELIVWSGWNAPNLLSFAKDIQPIGGGDYPEAAKTALNFALDVCDASSSTLILWYADAPPHAITSNGDNAVEERKIYPGSKSDFVELSREARNRNCTVFSFIPFGLEGSSAHFYVFLSQCTGGACIRSGTRDSEKLARLTLDVIIQRAGLFDWRSSEHDPLRHSKDGVQVYRFTEILLECRNGIRSEKEDIDLFTSDTSKDGETEVSELDLSRDVPGVQAGSVSTIAKRFADPSQQAYRSVALKILKELIETNVYALTYNPVFGQLWRAVCKQMDNPDKQELIDAFSYHVSDVKDANKNATLQKWLDESFDATEEIEEIIASVSKDSDFAYLDLDAGVDLIRKDLLEVSRSCYSGVLQKLATIFTHLKVSNDKTILAPKQRSIPLSLRPKDLFRILPHLVVPGTLFPPRASSLTAILALVTNVSFLSNPATELLEGTKGTWRNIDIPENLSFECARFLLTAPEGVALADDERIFYESMRRYKLIELNLDSTLRVEVPWTPDKTRGIGDIKLPCKRCGIRRSITILSHELDTICGLCVAFERDDMDKEKPPKSFAESDEMTSSWVECSNRECRSQYVVEDVSGLKVRPKCYYCRTGISCPYLECSKCTNRIVLPERYRDRCGTPFICPSCSNEKSNHLPVVTVETSSRVLKTENGLDWLGIVKKDGILDGKSAFKLIQAHGFDVFNRVDFPEDGKLVFRSKPVFNVQDVLKQVENRVGKGEIELGCCPLCFNDFMRDKLVPCCGRKGCVYRVDEKCLSQWYGANEPGLLLNVMQTTCPFCRRPPVTKTLARYNRRVATLGGLKAAIEDNSWYYAWCVACGYAKRAYERRCCDGDGALPPIQNFQCDDCKGKTDAPRVTACPNCGVFVEKISGCNHIECHCGQHFCYVCGKGESEDGIYEHMNVEHGSIYDDGVYADDEEL